MEQQENLVDWQPGTSLPGEMYTFEGRVRSIGPLARNARNRDPRYVAYKRSMARSGLMVLGVVGLMFAIRVLVALL